MSVIDVSIVMTTCDRPAWFEVALLSALTSAAARPDVETEVIVVDDASRLDYAPRLAKRYGVRCFRHAERIGYAWSRVFGLRQAKGRYVAFLDDDDALLPRWLGQHLERMADADVVAGSYLETDAYLYPMTPAVTLRLATFEGLLGGHCPVNDGALVRRSVLEGVTLRADRDTVMMYSLWLALAARGARFATVAEPTWLYRHHGANMSAHLDDRDAARRAEMVAEYQTEVAA